MKYQQPDLREYTLALSRTMISADPTDLLATIHVIGSDSWTQSAHPLHHMRLDGLKLMKKAIVKYRDAQSEDNKKQIEDKKLADEAVITFRLQVSRILIRRHDDSRWGGDRLLQLSALHVKRAVFVFPAKYVSAYHSINQEWSARNLETLKNKQAAWDTNQHDSKYLSTHPTRPETLGVDSVLNQSRMLRLCAKLLYLAVLVPTVDPETHRCTNDNAHQAFKDRVTGRIRTGSLLDQHYHDLSSDCPKILGIARILTSCEHRGEAVLIMSSFPEFLLVLERVSYDPRPCFAKTMTNVPAVLCSAHLEISLMMFVIADIF